MDLLSVKAHLPAMLFVIGESTSTSRVHDFRKSSILIAEATALRWQLQEAVKAGYNFIKIEEGNKIVIDVIEGQIQPPW